jgi:hypothetical protein
MSARQQLNPVKVRLAARSKPSRSERRAAAAKVEIWQADDAGICDLEGYRFRTALALAVWRLRRRGTDGLTINRTHGARA